MQHRDKHAPLKFSLKSDIDIKFKMSIMGFRIVYAVVVLFSIIALWVFFILFYFCHRQLFWKPFLLKL